MHWRTGAKFDDLLPASSRFVSGCVRFPLLSLKDDVEHYRQEVKERPQQNEDMKQFVEAEGRRRIRLLEDVKHRPNRIGDAARKQQGNRPRWNQLQRLPVKNDGPAHQKIKPRIQRPWGVHPAKLDQDAAQRHRPHPTDKQDAVHPLHELEADGGVGARNQHVDHCVVQLAQVLLLKNGAIVVVVERACTVQGQH